QLLAELLVVVRATQPAGVAEVNEFDAADRALPLEDARLLALLQGGGQLAPGSLRWRRVVEVLVGALLAEVEFLHLLLAEDLGDVQGRGLGTPLALHRRNSLFVLCSCISPCILTPTEGQ